MDTELIYPLSLLSSSPPCLNLTEIFQSVQGESSFSGLPTTFIRLAGCNLRCSWCDTTYSFARGKTLTLEEIEAEAIHRHVCITGGEPLLQEEVHSLMRRLCDKGHIVSLETGGSLPIAAVDPRVHVILDIKCPGSAMEHKNHWANIAELKLKDEVKFVIKDRTDFDYAQKVAERYQLFDKVKEVLFSPVFDVLDSRELVKWILEERLPVRLNLQLHKFIWAPQTRGV